jgi:cell wall-associated NlpC family hydrolase
MSGEVPAAERIPYTSLQPADVLFFGPNGPRSKPAQIDHTGIYLGGGWMIDAGSTGVHLSPIASGYYVKRFAWARRPLAEAGLE